MDALKLVLFQFILFSCNNNPVKKEITVIGKAENAKAGAIITMATDQKMFYIEGINSWDSNLTGKTIKVTGTLLIETIDPPKPNEPEEQQIVGKKRIIVNPRWEVIK